MTQIAMPNTVSNGTSTVNFPGTSGNSTPIAASDVFAQLEQRLNSTQAEEITLPTADGGSVTTIQGQNGPQIVSETSATGTTLTQVGFVSPPLFQQFLSNLFTALDADSTSSAAGGITATGTSNASSNADSTAADSMTNSVQALITQLNPNGADSADTASLVKSFDALLQNTGISPDASGSMTQSQGAAAQQAFLTSALPALKSGELNSTGLLVNTSA
jgi:hypothetical protein